MPLLRRLTDKGIEDLQQFLNALPTDPATPVPVGLLTDNTASEALPIEIDVQQKEFSSRMEAAEHIHSLLNKPEAAGMDRSRGIWAWLALFYFEQLCPLRKDGSRKPGKNYRWVPEGHAFRYYRHLLAGPYLIYKSFRDDPQLARIVLCGSLDTPGDFVEQLASRQDFVQNKTIIGAATTLYLNTQSGKPKRGTADTKHKPGTLRRFVDIINQLDPTWDLYSMTTVQLISRLPVEFDVFK
jgi:hypothetical protein